MAKYATKECFKCGLRRPVPDMKRKEVEKNTGRSGGSLSGKGTRKSIRMHTGRKYYRKVQVWQCANWGACNDPDYYVRKRKEQAEKDKARAEKKAENKRKKEESIRKAKENLSLVIEKHKAAGVKPADIVRHCLKANSLDRKDLKAAEFKRHGIGAFIFNTIWFYFLFGAVLAFFSPNPLAYLAILICAMCVSWSIIHKRKTNLKNFILTCYTQGIEQTKQPPIEKPLKPKVSPSSLGAGEETQINEDSANDLRGVAQKLYSSDNFFDIANMIFMHTIAKVDGEFHAKEKALIENLMDLAKDDIMIANQFMSFEKHYEFLTQLLKKRYSRKKEVLAEIINNLFFVAESDGNLALVELEQIRAIGKDLGISKAQMKKIETNNLERSEGDTEIEQGFIIDEIFEQLEDGPATRH